MDIYSQLSSEIEIKKGYSLKKAKGLIENAFGYEEYLNTKEYAENKKLQIYLNYMLESIFALQYLKKEIKMVPNFEDEVISRKILSVHLSAIKKAKDIDQNNDLQIIEFGFYYGWLSPRDYKNKNFLLAGKTVCKKLQGLNLPGKFIETTDHISQIAKLYEWRKMLWMRLSLLLPADSNKISKAVEGFIANKNKCYR
ncbi:MAG: hypothetical protein PHH82_04410 [Candidatus ainarchaeum sp.]|nr:hypothetical protein [Candidatus ainarchaeum sp.]